MKTVKVTTNNTVSVIDVDFDDYRKIQKAVGGHFETVRTRRMMTYFKDPDFIMLVDEEGWLKGLHPNALGSAFYGSAPIVGDIIFAKIVEDDFTAPDDAEAIKDRLLRDFPILKEDKNGTDNSKL